MECKAKKYEVQSQKEHTFQSYSEWSQYAQRDYTHAYCPRRLSKISSNQKPPRLLN